MNVFGYGPNNLNLKSNFKDIISYRNPPDLNICGELLEQNLINLYSILEFNNRHNIKLYCISDTIIPYSGFYKLEDLHNYSDIEFLIYMIRNEIKDQRLFFILPEIYGLAYCKKSILQKLLYKASAIADFMDRLDIPKNHNHPIITNVGYHYTYKENAAKRATEVAISISESFYSRCVITNSYNPKAFDIDTILNLKEHLPFPISLDISNADITNKYKNMLKDQWIESFNSWKEHEPIFLSRNDNSFHEEKISNFKNEDGFYLQPNILLQNSLSEINYFRYLRKNYTN